MVNMKKVSEAVIRFVEQTKLMDGTEKKKNAKINSDREFNELANYLAGKKLNNDERDYIQGFMIEYQNEKFMERVTPNAKETLEAIKGSIIKDKSISNGAEARQIIDLLNNTDNQFNEADLEFFVKELIKSGYEDLIKDSMRTGKLERNVAFLSSVLLNQGEVVKQTQEKVERQAAAIDDLKEHASADEKRLNRIDEINKNQDARATNLENRVDKQEEVNAAQQDEINTQDAVNERQQNELNEQKQVEELRNKILSKLNAHTRASRERVETEIAKILNSSRIDHNTKIDLLKKLEYKVSNDSNLSARDIHDIYVTTTTISL